MTLFKLLSTVVPGNLVSSIETETSSPSLDFVRDVRRKRNRKYRGYHVVYLCTCKHGTH